VNARVCKYANTGYIHFVINNLQSLVTLPNRLQHFMENGIHKFFPKFIVLLSAMFIFCSLLLTFADNLTISFLFEQIDYKITLACEFCYENKRFLNQIPRNNRVTHGNRRT
jgi:hypothetical protein